MLYDYTKDIFQRIVCLFAGKLPLYMSIFSMFNKKTSLIRSELKIRDSTKQEQKSGDSLSKSKVLHQGI